MPSQRFGSPFKFLPSVKVVHLNVVPAYRQSIQISSKRIGNPFNCHPTVNAVLKNVIQHIDNPFKCHAAYWQSIKIKIEPDEYDLSPVIVYVKDSRRLCDV